MITPISPFHGSPLPLQFGARLSPALLLSRRDKAAWLWVHRLVLALLLLWGIAVIADSPQFSAMSVQAYPPQLLGSALTIQNCLGFALTTVSIPIATGSFPTLGPHVAWIMLPGPIFGLIGTRRLLKSKRFRPDR